MQAKEKRIEEKTLTIVSAIEVESIHIPQNEARNLYDSTVPIWNMTGEYMIGVEVFHQLHCLVSCLIKYLRILSTHCFQRVVQDYIMMIRFEIVNN